MVLQLLSATVVSLPILLQTTIFVAPWLCRWGLVHVVHVHVPWSAVLLCVGVSQHMVVVNCVPHQRCRVDGEAGLLQCRPTHSVWAGGAVYQVLTVGLHIHELHVYFLYCSISSTILFLQVKWRGCHTMVSWHTKKYMYMHNIHAHRQWLYGSMWVGLYILHVAYLSLGKFHYGYNMAACVIAGMPVKYNYNLVRLVCLPSCRHCVCGCVDTVVYQGTCTCTCR